MIGLGFGMVYFGQYTPDGIIPGNPTAPDDIPPYGNIYKGVANVTFMPRVVNVTPVAVRRD